jgi:hypothetical protein
LAKLRADFRAKTLPILDQIQDNRLIYKALVNNNNASTDEVKKAVAELSRLRKELRAEKDDFRKSLSELGLPGQFGRGYGCRGDWGDRDDLDDRDDGDDRYDWDDGDDRYDWDDGPRRHRGGRSHRY